MWDDEKQGTPVTMSLLGGSARPASNSLKHQKASLKEQLGHQRPSQALPNCKGESSLLKGPVRLWTNLSTLEMLLEGLTGNPLCLSIYGAEYFGANHFINYNLRQEPSVTGC